MKLIKTDICIIGAGAGGLSVAAGAAQMGAEVVLIEKGRMGGDCLNYGCVPSKSLLSASHIIDTLEAAKQFGIHAQIYDVNYVEVFEHIHKVIGTVAPKDSQERFEKLGVKVIKGAASFKNTREVMVAGKLIRAKYFVVATGSKPVILPIKGLDKIDYMTNETIFELKEIPEHMIVIGGGPIGCELSQGIGKLGAKVSLIQRRRILVKDDPELTKYVHGKLVEDGIDVYEHTNIERVEKVNSKINLYFKHNDKPVKITGSHLLLAVGRQPEFEGLNLGAAEVKYSERGIQVNSRLRTSNKRIFALGDAAVGYKFTHMAGYQAGIVIRNILFRLPAKVNYSAVPWVTYTEPELAHVGLHESEAKKRYKDIKVLSLPFAENDRAQCELKTSGAIKVITRKNGRILGASIVGSNAGELLGPWCVAVTNKLKIGSMASCIIPYPTRGEINKQVAGSFYTPVLFSEKTRRIVKLIMKWL
ncbi:MAG: FAD-dependent oxidoreductase [Lentisphaerae bacterium]|nr:FAD-dependent oxidoreductase [Lentisphaerota bacterium]MCP4102112.1 FAD-dependent oxidoreductase [Lentisphaerota bacterium]